MNVAGSHIPFLTFIHFIFICFTPFLNPLSSSSDKHQISPGDIIGESSKQIMRIKEIITKDKLL